MVGCANRATATLTRRFLGFAEGATAEWSAMDDVLAEAAPEGGARLSIRLTSVDAGAEAATGSRESSAVAAASEALVEGSMLRRRPTAFFALCSSSRTTSAFLARDPVLATSNGARLRRLALILAACDATACGHESATHSHNKWARRR